jgi:hypothetical protein
MTPGPLEICAAIVPLGQSKDRRPWLILEVLPAGRLRALPISSNLTLMDPLQHFLLRKGHPDFEATGLRRESYVLADHPVEIDASALEARLGRLRGGLASEFLAWLGYEG